MNLDVVMPKNNETEILQIAEKLGFKELIFLYYNLEKKPLSIPLSIRSEKIKVFSAGLIKSIKEVDKAKKNFDLVFGFAHRGFFENKKVKYLIDAENSLGEDFLYQRRAGLDDVMCRLAKEKDKTIVFNLQLLIRNNNINNRILGRMMQNAKLCRKYKAKTLIATLATAPLEMRAPKDLDGFARTLKLL